MKVETKTEVYITPDSGETVLEISKEIAARIKDGTIQEGEIFFNLPNGKSISVKGKDTSSIRDSIMLEWNGSGKF